MRIPIVTGALALSVLAWGQPVQAQGKIEILEPWAVTHLLDQHAEFIEEIETIEGYRVQILATTDLDQANAVKARCLMYFKDKSYLDFFSPYYKVRIGDFRTKLEAYACLMKVKEHFPDAYIVLDMIQIKEL
jgi:hypothetical protein